MYYAVVGRLMLMLLLLLDLLLLLLHLLLLVSLLLYGLTLGVLLGWQHLLRRLRLRFLLV